MKIKIGTRKSKLALAQTEMFIAKLKSVCNDIEIETVHISTKGDKVLDKSLSSIGGKGVFISELESALLSGEIDLAVHSAKDLPLELAEGLEISAVLERGNYRDVLVTKNNSPIKNSSDFVVGTGSIRRRSFLHRLYPLVTVKDIRGNVDTRLKIQKELHHDIRIPRLTADDVINAPYDKQRDGNRQYKKEYVSLMPHNL